MPRLIEAHGHEVVPVDLDLKPLAPRPDLLEAALAGLTNVLLVAHLFERRVNLAHLRPSLENTTCCSPRTAPKIYGAPAIWGTRRRRLDAGFGPTGAATALGGTVLAHARSMHPRYSWVSLAEAHRRTYDGSRSRARQLVESGAPTVMRSGC